MRAKSTTRTSSTTNRPTSRARLSPATWFFIIACVALVLRLIHLLQLRHNDLRFFSPQMDALYHHQWALAIAAGREFIADAFFRAPLYPYFLGLVYKLTGANQMVARIIQALIGSAGCGLVYLLARQLLRPQAGKSDAVRSSFIVHRSGAVPLIAGFVMAAYPLAIWYDGELLLEGLLTFLVLLGFVLLLRSWDEDRQWWLPGIVFGLAAITRPNVLAFLAVLPVWLFLEGKGFRGSRVRGFRSDPRTRSVWSRLLAVWGLSVLVILPVTIRNYVASRQFVPIAWQGGTNFYIGNSPKSDGVTAILPGTRADWWGGYDDVKRLAEEALGRPLKGAEIDRYWMSKGLEFWREQPGKALALLARKTFLWFAGYEVGNESDLYMVKRYSFVNYLFFNTRLLKFPFGILLPLALAGVWLHRRQWRRFLPLYLFIVAYSLSFIFFFVTSRYRVPMVPLVLILAGMGLVGLMGRMRGRGMAAIIAVASFFLLNANLAVAGRKTSRDQGHFVIAAGLHEQGRDSEALTEVRRALAFDSAANALSLEAQLLALRGDQTEAERAGRAAIRLHPLNGNAYGVLGNVFANAGKFDSAARYYELALQRVPYSPEAWTSLGSMALLRRDYEKARYYYEGALKIRPTHVEAMFYLGLADYYEGKTAEAHARWQQVLKLDPSFTRAREALEQLK